MTRDERLGARIRVLREALGWSGNELERRSGVSRRQIMRVERGVCSPSVATVADIAQALGVQPSVLVAAVDVGADMLIVSTGTDG